jgi:hypothetical protein
MNTCTFMWVKASSYIEDREPITRGEASEYRLFLIAHGYSAIEIKAEMSKYYIID